MLEREREGRDDCYKSKDSLNKGDLLKYPQNQKSDSTARREKRYSPTHPFLMIKTCIHETHEIPPPPPQFE